AYVRGEHARQRNADNAAPTQARYGVTENALRDVTQNALMRVWEAVTRHCKFDGEDAVMKPFTLDEVDRVAGIRGFGSAMEEVGWVEKADDKSLRFKNFREHNDPSKGEAEPKTAAERQKAFREKKKARNATVTKSNATV